MQGSRTPGYHFLPVHKRILCSSVAVQEMLYHVVVCLCCVLSKMLLLQEAEVEEAEQW